MYQLTGFNVVLRLSDKAFIQPAEGNRDWLEYQLWKTGGNTPLPAPLPDLQPLYASKLAAINEACEASITGGFWSAALGERYQYSSQLEDQLNLNGVVMAGLDSLYPCRDEQGIKEFRAHTVDQLRQVGSDFTQFKLQLLQKAAELKQQLDQALADGDLDALQSVNWDSEQ